MQDVRRLWNWYHRTTGGYKCWDILVSISAPVIFVCGLSLSDIYLLKNCTLLSYTSNLSNYIMDGIFLISNLLRTSVEESIFLPTYLIFWHRSTWFPFMSDHSITDYMVSHNLHGTLDFIFENFSILRVVICLLQSSDIILVTKY